MPTEAEKFVVQYFLKSAQGDMALNKQLREIGSQSLRDTGLSSIAIGNAIQYSFKTRRVETFEEPFERLTKNYNRIINGMELDNEHKISLSEYSNVYDIARVRPTMESYERLGFLDGDQELTTLFSKMKKSEEIMKKMESDYRESYTDEPGRIVFDNTKNKSSVLGKSLSFFENLIRKVITSHGHASKLYSRPDGTEALSHINPGPVDDEFKMRDYLYADTYQIQIDKLISKEQQTLLEKAFGENWKQEVNTMFKQVERDIHDGTIQNFSGLSASAETEQYKSGLASLLPFGLGHKQFKENDFKDIHKKVMEGHYKKNRTEMLCSEFVAHTTIAGLVELNKRLDTKLKEKDLPVPIGKDIVKIPIGKHENLHKMHPDRLLKVLKKANCIQKAAPNKGVAKYFKSGKSKALSSQFKNYKSGTKKEEPSVRTITSDKPPPKPTRPQ